MEWEVKWVGQGFTKEAFTWLICKGRGQLIM